MKLLFSCYFKMWDNISSVAQIAYSLSWSEHINGKGLPVARLVLNHSQTHQVGIPFVSTYIIYTRLNGELITANRWNPENEKRLLRKNIPAGNWMINSKSSLCLIMTEMSVRKKSTQKYCTHISFKKSQCAWEQTHSSGKVSSDSCWWSSQHSVSAVNKRLNRFMWSKLSLSPNGNWRWAGKNASS